MDIWLNYGLSEIPGPAIAYECCRQGGLHINDDHILPEIINPDTGRPVHAGEEGELVLTTLSARAFPLIRFRTGDMAKFLTAPCACGSPFTKIEWLSQRADNYMILSGIKVSLDQVKEYLKAALGLPCPDCTVERMRQGGTDIMVISLVMGEDLFSDEIKNLQNLMHRTEATLTEQIGVPIKIRLVQKR